MVITLQNPFGITEKKKSRLVNPFLTLDTSLKEEEKPKLTIKQKIKEGVKGYAEETGEVVSNFPKTVKGFVKDPLGAIKRTFGDPIVESEMRAGENLYDLITEKGAANRVANGAKLITNTIGAILSPITGLFTMASKVPGLKTVGDVLMIPPTVGGFVSSWGSGKAIDWIPESVMSKESKEIVKQPIQELSNVVGQVVVGGIIMKKVSEMVGRNRVVTPKEATRIVEEARVEAVKEHPKVFEPERPTVGGEIRPREQFTDVTRTSRTGVTPELSDISRTSLKIQQEAGKVGIDVPTSELSLIDRMKMDEQARQARDLISKDIEAAKEAIRVDTNGFELKTQSIFKELKKQMIDTADANLALELSRSKIGTMSGQALKALDDSATFHSDPVRAIQEIREVREKQIPKIYKGKSVEKVVREIKQSVPKIEKVKGEPWGSFLDSIIC